VDDAAFIDTSFPGFVTLMNALGAAIAAEADVGERGAAWRDAGARDAEERG
jgi:hypothetical protein